MTRFELRWAHELLEGFAPPINQADQREGSVLSARPGEVDYVTTFLRMRAQATPLAGLGLRLALWLAAWAPLWLWRRAGSISGVSVRERPDLLVALLEHRSFAVRELTLLLKLVAAMALLGSPAVRARSGYDRAPITINAPKLAQLRLPLAAQPTLPAHVAPANDVLQGGERGVA